VAELSADDAQRLARQFLTGKAEPADVARLAAALPEDQTLALELLAQMQAALDDVAPSALTAEQDRSVDARIEALIAPRIKKRGLFGWVRKLFGRRPKAAAEALPSRRKRRGGEAPEPVAELPAPVGLPVGEDVLEETMPGLSPQPAPEPAPSAAPPAPAPRRQSAPARPSRWRPVLGALLLALLLGYGAWWGYRRWQARPPQPAAEAVPAPAAVEPTPLPTPSQPQRARSTAGQADETLPALLPPTTPQPAGWLPLEP
jgi:hypothetical protein